MSQMMTGHVLCPNRWVVLAVILVSWISGVGIAADQLAPWVANDGMLTHSANGTPEVLALVERFTSDQGGHL